MNDQLITIAKEVYSNLGGGYTENIYHKALEVEFRNRGIKYTSGEVIPIYYKGFSIGHRILDLVVDNNIIIELKSVTKINASHIAQIKSYLNQFNGSNIIGILINFPNEGEIETKIIT